METGINKVQYYLTLLGFFGFLVWKLFLYFISHTYTGKLLMFVLLPAAIVYGTVFRPPPESLPEKPAVSVQIPGGAHFSQIADSLEAAGALENRFLFRALGRISGKDKNLRAGYFEVPADLTAWQLLNYLENAPVKRFKVTFPEGILSYRMGAILEKSLQADSARFVSLVHDSAFAGQQVPGETSLEGYLLPETYFFEWKTPAEPIINHMVSNTLSIFRPDSVQERLEQLEMSRREILILASIIEGEALVDSERVYVSSVYHNRLKLGWPLQADPTIQFALPGPPRRLLHRDLEIDSPYNTYKYPGLPPGPINNPGRSSILAALYPANTAYLYMVAIGDGRHKFSKTLREHNRWHAKFNEVRRRVRREQRQNQSNP